MLSGCRAHVICGQEEEEEEYKWEEADRWQFIYYIAWTSQGDSFNGIRDLLASPAID